MTNVKARLRFLSFFAVLFAVGYQTGCGGPASSGTGPLPTPPAQDVKLSDYQPQRGFVQVSPGLLTRSVFVVEPSAKNPYHVDVQDILVAPGKEAVALPLQGAGVFEVRTGTGAATIGEKTQELNVGATFSVAEGEALKIAARGDGPISLRAYVVKVP